jgi:amino acid permease
MKYVKNAILILAVALLAILIILAAKQNNFAVAGMLAVPFLLLAFVIHKFSGRIKNFKIDLDDKSLSVNQEDKDESSP